MGGLAPAARAVTFSSDTLIAPTNTAYDGEDIVITNCTVTIDGPHGFLSLHVLSGGTLTHSALTNNGGGALNLVLTNDVEIEIGGTVTASARGYGPALGPGAGTTRLTNSPYSYYAGSGGGYGGYGGNSSSQATGGTCYGSISAPVIAGSGGGAGSGAGGAGGGVINLAAGGILRIDGLVSADGADGLNPQSGGGAGGSLWLSAQTVLGSGVVSANGGDGEPGDGGGGGGGRIAVYSATNSFAGTLSARGGAGFVRGGAGTIYAASTGAETNASVLVDNGGWRGTNTVLSVSNPIALTIAGGAVVQPSINLVLNRLVIQSNSWFTWLPMQSQSVTVLGDAVIETSAGFVADGTGFGSGVGSGAGHTVFATNVYSGGGGGYGGVGAASAYGAAGGSSYGSQNAPDSLGSGGGSGNPQGAPGGYGGGNVRLTVNGTLTLNGIASANGLAGRGAGSGGGSGGSVWLTAGTLTGNGAISANGGGGQLPFGGGGGGGRIAIYFTNNQFTGTLSAQGGRGATNAAAGTIYWQPANNAIAAVIIDNGGLLTPSNTVVTVSRIPIDLTVQGGAVAALSGSPVFRNLLVASNSWLTSTVKSDALLVVIVTNNAIVQTNAGLLFDGFGSAPGSGAGAGHLGQTVFGLVGSGAGHGGFGGSSISNSALGGLAYDSAASPTLSGSGGGNGGSPVPFNLGGTGGRALQLIVSNTLVLDGIISANGTAGAGQGSGGGSGGSVWLTVGTLSGAGSVAANGGAGDLSYGGGGGGGRIALYYNASHFVGVLTAYGGIGASTGGAGTIYLQERPLGGSPRILISIDNGGRAGTNTPLPSLVTYDLKIVGSGRALTPIQAGTVNLGNLTIASNSWLFCSNAAPPNTLNVNTNATIQAGGGIRLDGAGSSGGSGIGAGRSGQGLGGIFMGSGGGYGGSGGPSAAGLSGGSQYGSILAPINPGSGGGNTTGQGPYNLGGAGGGALRLTVAGTLALDGVLNANGGPAVGTASGGGSGGSIYLTAGKLTGSGSLSANGGSGDLPYGGGGGGGRIAVYCGTNQFAGGISASGGPGATSGGAGTIYLVLTNFPVANRQLIIDNGGASAPTNTTLSGLQENLDLTISGGARANLSATSIRSLLITSNSWLTLSSLLPIGPWTGLTVTSNATIQAGGGITLDGAGYAGGAGPGAGHSVNSIAGLSGSGGGYGGYGASSFFGAAGGLSYGSLTAPSDSGSGGGNANSPYNLGGAGGGAARLTVNGTFALDGRLSADGLVGVGSGSGGGAGGSMYLTTGILSGTGLISASGGAGDPSFGGGGGGGRIAIYCDTNLFTGRIIARGGPGAGWGGAGTIYIAPNRSARTIPQLIIDNGGPRGTNTPLSVSNLLSLNVTGGGVATPVALGTLSSLTVGSNSWLVYSNGAHAPLNVGVAVIQEGGGISLDAAGFVGGQGPGAGGYLHNDLYGNSGGGGGYGGLGASSVAGASGGNSYGSVLQPTDLGSGGGTFTTADGGFGGGALQINVTKSLQLDGAISANGGDFLTEGGGGGSGGSLWLTVGALSGTGTISANGGDGDYFLGGGGGGGRIVIFSATNQFQGPITAWGGLGAFSGGAGTIYCKTGSATIGQVIVDNGGGAGTNTPLATAEPFALTVSGAAIVSPASGPLVLGSLHVDAGGVLTHLSTQSNLDVTVLTNMVVGSNGAIVVDGMGYRGTNGGPGAGPMTNSFSGGGGGYGGPGGAGISGIPGGSPYGSAFQPADRGSRGGVYPILSNFCQGGGAVLLKIGGTLTIDGVVSANGNAALIEGGGGGAGGSVWLTARNFAGGGMIFANGGPGESDQGGGGGGGRIAVYCLSNSFAGLLAAAGGTGASPGGAGTVYVTNTIPFPQIALQSPSGTVESAVSYLDLTFGSPMDFSSASPTDFSLDSPNGLLPPGSLTTLASSVNTIRVSFPVQNTLGYYEIQAGPLISDIYGQSMAAPYLGTFAIVPPLISGRVVDTNGLGVPFLTIQVSGDAFPTLTDSNGFYSLEVFPNWAGTITPERGGRIFIPPSRNYTNVSNDLTNQNFVMATASTLALNTSQQGTNLNLSWYGINGVSYQILYSSNLVNWVPYGLPVKGTNGPAGVLIPIDLASPADFFRFSAGY
jgi:hypothetical protein